MTHLERAKEKAIVRARVLEIIVFVVEATGTTPTLVPPAKGQRTIEYAMDVAAKATFARIAQPQTHTLRATARTRAKEKASLKVVLTPKVRARVTARTRAVAKEKDCIPLENPLAGCGKVAATMADGNLGTAVGAMI